MTLHNDLIFDPWSTISYLCKLTQRRLYSEVIGSVLGSYADNFVLFRNQSNMPYFLSKKISKEDCVINTFWIPKKNSHPQANVICKCIFPP